MDKHKKIKMGLRIAGLSLLAIGLTLAVIGFVDFFNSFGTMGKPSKFFLLFIGFPLIGFGAVMTFFSFKKEIITYVKNESVPVIKEASTELKSAVGNIAAAAKEGFTNSNGKVCSCGERLDADSKFCDKCGKSLVKKCASCNAENDADSVFCKNCGSKLN